MKKQYPVIALSALLIATYSSTSIANDVLYQDVSDVTNSLNSNWDNTFTEEASHSNLQYQTVQDTYTQPQISYDTTEQSINNTVIVEPLADTSSQPAGYDTQSYEVSSYGEPQVTYNTHASNGYTNDYYNNQQQHGYQNGYQNHYQQPLTSNAQVNYQPQTHQQPVSTNMARPTLPPSELQSRLVTAVTSGNLSDMRWLVRSGANPKQRIGYSEETLVDKVIKSGRVDMMQVFHEAGVDLISPGKDDTTYLHTATAHGKASIVKYLVRIGANPNAVTRKNWTALHHAARFGHGELVSYLLGVGADTTTRNSDGLTPRELAQKTRNFDVARLF